MKRYIKTKYIYCVTVVNMILLRLKRIASRTRVNALPKWLNQVVPAPFRKSVQRSPPVQISKRVMVWYDSADEKIVVEVDISGDEPVPPEEIGETHPLFNKESIRDAIINPSKYPNLIIRFRG
jgi:hypothetical protein